MYVVENADSNRKLVLQTSRLLLEHTFSETWINTECILRFFFLFSMASISLAEIISNSMNVILYDSSA